MSAPARLPTGGAVSSFPFYRPASVNPRMAPCQTRLNLVRKPDLDGAAVDLHVPVSQPDCTRISPEGIDRFCGRMRTSCFGGDLKGTRANPGHRIVLLNEHAASGTFSRSRPPVEPPIVPPETTPSRLDLSSSAVIQSAFHAIRLNHDAGSLVIAPRQCASVLFSGHSTNDLEALRSRCQAQVARAGSLIARALPATGPSHE